MFHRVDEKARIRLKGVSDAMDNKEFASASGKTIETVAFSSQPDFHIFTLRFKDRTALVFRVEPGFTVRADYSDWQTGDQRILEEWPPISSASYFDSAKLGTSVLEWHGIADTPPSAYRAVDDQAT